MSKVPEPSRREFLSSSGKLMVGQALLTLAPTPAEGLPREPVAMPPRTPMKSQLKVDEFFFGADVYPELQTRDEWNRMLDHFQRAQMNAVRVSESSWGNLETASGKYDFGWLQHFPGRFGPAKHEGHSGNGFIRAAAMAGRRQPGHPGATSPRREGASHGAACTVSESSAVSKRACANTSWPSAKRSMSTRRSSRGNLGMSRKAPSPGSATILLARKPGGNG